MGRFRRVAEAFDVAAMVRDCDSSGSEHSTEMMKDLSDLVNSFIENGDGVVDSDFDMRINDECNSDATDDHMEETKESLKTLFRSKKGDADYAVRKNLLLNVERAWRRVMEDNSAPPLPGSKRLLMARLRDQGLDAGLCKSKWEKKGRLISGEYQYVDVNVAGTRYIVTISLSEEFETARPTDNYTSLLEILPQISVCKVEEMKEVVRIMCRAVKKTMNQRKMAVPPWKRREYVQAKWFGSYKRTTNEFSTKNTTDLNVNEKKIEGFTWTPEAFYCRRTEDFGRKEFGLRMGNLTMAMNGAS
ncbi:uncharacterized protein LOC111883204 [Lactuca sativa]|uniref:DUF506 family protein n=1 Tax=Lactuca sativa TaxID=4236 RepID=A0A9R1VUY8_LACSA|nr:uncharacterized protein LOC111883204 [Lactuca sativa]KAJ0213046.1 hypothetical protein LSAT_V11C400181390 [Lactuca sativa]